MKNRIKELRKSKHITQAELAKHIGVAQNTLSYWEQGKYDVDNESLKKLADFFECSTDSILGRDSVTVRSELSKENENLMFALFGNVEEIDEKDLEDVRRYAAFIREKKKK